MLSKWHPKRLKEWNTKPTSCLGQRDDMKDSCLYFTWKRFDAFDRKGYEALQVIQYEGSEQWFRRRAPYCKAYMDFHHKLSMNWSKEATYTVSTPTGGVEKIVASDDYSFLRQTWRLGCERGKIRNPVFK